MTATNATKSKVVYTIIERKEETGKDSWVRIGRAFVNKDQSMNVYLDALPTNGKMQVRDQSEKNEKHDDLPLGA